MSFQMIEAVKPLQLPPTAKFVLFLLADAHNAQTNACHPGYAYLMQATCLSNKTIANSLQLLKDRGVIDFDSKKGRNTAYKITPEALHLPSKVVNLVHKSPRDKVVKEVHISCEGGSHICEGGSQEPELTGRNRNLTRATSKKSAGKGRKKSSEADSRFVPFRNAWMEAYREAHGSDYHFHRHDGVQLVGFLKRDKTMTLSEWDGFLTWLNKSMIDNGQFTNGLIKLAAGSLASACSKFNQLLVLSLHETKRTNR